VNREIMPAERSRAGSARLPRALHPMAWWIWAIGLATAASRTTNPLLLLMILAVAGYVVAARRTDAPWARAFHYYLGLGLSVIAIRIVFRSLLGADDDPSAHVLMHLPQIPLPHWVAGVRLGGPVTLEGTLAAAYDGLRLATLLCCIGAANALANPKRALRVLPGALYELGVAVIVSVTVAPQLIESAQRVRRARRLRGGGGREGLRMLHTVALPVLQDALDRSLRLAAAMDSRGYGRRAGSSASARRATAVLLIGGLMALCFGAYGLLDGSGSAAFALPALAVGAALCCAGLAVGSRRVHVTNYRPDPWRTPEWLVAGCGLASGVIMVLAGHYDPAELNPSLSPLAWPNLPFVALVGILLGAVAAFAAPPVPRALRAAAPDPRPQPAPRAPAGVAS
jgi:energy-coupling factor transport system permease protein